MKILILLLKIVFWPIWIPYWLFIRNWKLLLVLLVIGNTGCANSSNRFEKSPCACEFERVNVGEASADAIV